VWRCGRKWQGWAFREKKAAHRLSSLRKEKVSHLKIIKKKPNKKPGAGGVTQVVECLP
jgi:hypothetical protein